MHSIGCKVLVCALIFVIVIICALIGIGMYYCKSTALSNGVLIYLNQNRADDPFKLNRKIADGGQGTVYEVRNRNNESYAIKTFKYQKGCAREANIFRQLDDVKHVPKMYNDLCEPFNSIQMQLITGETLDKAKFEYADAWKQVHAIIQAMAKKGVYHNDLWLPNMIKSDDGILIIDFGRAEYLNFNDTESLQSSVMVTSTEWIGAPQKWILDELARYRYQNNVSNIQEDEELIKKLSFDMNAYYAQKVLFGRTLSKQQKSEIDGIQETNERWLWWKETAKNSTQYLAAHRSQAKEQFLINGIEECAQMYGYAKEIKKRNKKSGIDSLFA